MNHVLSRDGTGRQPIGHWQRWPILAGLLMGVTLIIAAPAPASAASTPASVAPSVAPSVALSNTASPDADRDAGMAATAPGATAAQVMTGRFTYLADAPRIERCADGRRLPVAMEADYLSLERAYRTVREAHGIPAGRPILVKVEGRLALRPSMEETQPPQLTLVVERFIHARPTDRCKPHPPGTRRSQVHAPSH